MEYEMKCLAGREPRIHVTDDFVRRNNLKIDPEAAINIMRESSFLGFEKEVASSFLTLEQAQEFLSDEGKDKYYADPSSWSMISDVNEAAQDVLDYMVFGWMKAIDERGISSSRSIQKLSAWMKILSRPDVADILTNNDRYSPYGRPALKDACVALGIPYPDYLWPETERNHA